MLLDDTGDGSARKEGGRHVKIVVSFQDEMKWKEVSFHSKHGNRIGFGMHQGIQIQFGLEAFLC